MSVASSLVPPRRLIYPETDGKPMAENTVQFDYITKIKGGLDFQYRADPNVFVAGDLFWYPVEGAPEIRMAPDTLVVFGRPKGHRGSYRQWEEGNIAPQVVFEIWSPGNRPRDMVDKLDFYQTYGVEEFYLFDPESSDLLGWQRQGPQLVSIPHMNGWISPRLGVRFELKDGALELFHPDGSRFETFLETAQAREWAREQLEQERQRAQQEKQRAEQEKQRAEQEKQRAERLAERLRALGIDPNS